MYITAVSLNDSRCVPKSEVNRYALSAKTVGTVTAAGYSVPLTASNASVSTWNSCVTGEGSPAGTDDTEDPPPGAPVCGLRLDDVKVAFGDVTVGSVALTGLSATNVGVVRVTSTSDNEGTIEPGGLQLSITGAIDGVESMLNVANSSPWKVSIGTDTVTLGGDIDVVTGAVGSTPVVTKASVNIAAVTATPAQVACAAATPRDRLFGFEERAQWASTDAALSWVDAAKTQGCSAIAVFGQNFMGINSDRFSTSGLALASALDVDLFIPTNQPNPFWFGELQMNLSCPSGDVYDQYIGEVPLTGRSKGEFSTLRFPLPAAVTTTLLRGLNDCSLRLGLNVNQTDENWILDNMRFAP